MQRFLPVLSCQAPRGVGRMDAGRTALGCPSPPGCLHHPQDAADIFQVQKTPPLRSLSVRERGACEILQGGCWQRAYAREVFSLLLRKQLINLTLIQKILRWRHLKLTFMAERPPPQSLQQELLMATEEREEYF